MKKFLGFRPAKIKEFIAPIESIPPSAPSLASWRKRSARKPVLEKQNLKHSERNYAIAIPIAQLPRNHRIP